MLNFRHFFLDLRLVHYLFRTTIATELTARSAEPKPVTSYYTTPQSIAPEKISSLKEFWQGQKRMPQAIPYAAPTGVSAILIKKQGDRPAFWHKDNSFIETMEELYERVKTKNTELL